MDHKILNLLYRSFDTELKKHQRKKLEKALEQSEGLREEKTRIAAQRRAVSQTPKPSFAPGFARRVRARIEALERERSGLERFYATLVPVFRGFAIAGAAVLLILLVYNLNVGDILPGEEMLFVSDATIQELMELPLF
ncbi:MAG: hypothetical protein ACE5LV_07490 [Candidatus Aminicenantales bacterium]